MKSAGNSSGNAVDSGTDSGTVVTPVTATASAVAPAAGAKAEQVDIASTGYPASAAADAGYVVQLASVRSREDAEAEWLRLQSRYEQLLGDMNGEVAQANLGDRGIFYRLRVGPFTEKADANTVCRALAAVREACFVVPLADRAQGAAG